MRIMHVDTATRRDGKETFCRVAADGKGCGRNGCECSPPNHIIVQSCDAEIVIAITDAEARRLRERGRLAVHHITPDAPPSIAECRAALEYFLGRAAPAATDDVSPEQRDARARQILGRAMDAGLLDE